MPPATRHRSRRSSPRDHVQRLVGRVEALRELDDRVGTPDLVDEVHERVGAGCATCVDPRVGVSIGQRCLTEERTRLGR